MEKHIIFDKRVNITFWQ